METLPCRPACRAKKGMLKSAIIKEEDMQGNFALAHQFTARWEGGLTDHPQDRGGITAYGASLAFVSDMAATPDGIKFLKSIGVKPLPVCRQTILALSRAQAAAMFEREFWQTLNLSAFHPAVGAAIYDAAVNCGPVRGVKFAQEGANESRDSRLVCDGILGPLTKNALAEPDSALLTAICSRRRNYCLSIARNQPPQKVFLQGWLNRVNDLEKFILNLLP